MRTTTTFDMAQFVLAGNRGTGESAAEASARAASAGRTRKARTAIARSGEVRYIPLMAEYSNYQKKVIRRFYENREQGDEQRLAELVTNLYLSEGKKREKLWTQAEETMLRLKVPKKRVEHLIKTKDPALIAAVVQELEAGTLKREAPPAPPVT